MAWDCLWINARLANFSQPIIDDGAIGVKDGIIVWVGKKTDLPHKPEQCAKKIVSLDDRLVTPGLIDCHTHLIYAGDRSNEFTRRLAGETYESIARAGGGIQATVSATRAATESQLFDESLPRLKTLLSEGVTTVEIKSGYGLDNETEKKILRVAKKLADTLPVTIKTSFLGAHALSPDFTDKDAYINFICDVVLPEIAAEKLIDMVDGFCETIGFNEKQIEKLFIKAQSLKLPVKLHAEQLSNQGGAALAAKYHALSADHLEHLSEEGVKAMASAGTVAVLLPGAFYFLRDTKIPPIDLLRKYRVPIAIATDCNPGSSPCTSLLLMLNMACTLFRLTPTEALCGVTKWAAKALGLSSSHGELSVGKTADFVAWNITSPETLCYQFGFNPCHQIIQRGIVHDQK